MTNWLKIFLPRKYAVIDGRRVTEPIINGSDTTFTVTGDSNWGSTSKYNVHLHGPNSYYQYRTLSEPKDDPFAGGMRQEQITVTGNEPEILNRYRGYFNSLAPEDYKYWWQHMFSKTPEKACGGKVQKGEDGMITGEFAPNWNQGEIRQGFQPARPNWLQKFDKWADKKSEELNNPKKTGPLGLLIGPAFDYLTQRPGNIGYAAILPGINAAGKAAVGKSAKALKSAQLEKEISNAFKAKGLKEQMAKWDQELLTNADRNIIKPIWLDKLNLKNDNYIKELDLSNLIKKENPAKDWGIGLAGLSAVGIPGTYFITRDSEKKKKAKSDVKEKPETKEKPEKKAVGGKISDLLNNQEFLVNLEKCGGKIKKACGGKMKKKK